MIVVVDDEDRENEGDLVMAARWITPEAINFMTHYGRGLICLAIDRERLDESELPAMVPSNTALGGTGFSVSIDAKEPGMTTGTSARDRAQTIRRAIDPATRTAPPLPAAEIPKGRPLPSQESRPARPDRRSRRKAPAPVFTKRPLKIRIGPSPSN